MVYRPYKVFFNCGKLYLAQVDDRGFHYQPPSYQRSEFADCAAAEAEASRRNLLMASGRNPFTEDPIEE